MSAPRGGPLLAVAAMALSICACRAQDSDLIASLEKYLLAAHNAWNFQGAVLVARREKVVFKAGFGFADEAGTRRITPSTQFSIGSVTKTLTAAAILLLRDEGRVDLDDPVTIYIPEYSPPGEAKVTLRHLLSHTSGVPDAGLDPRALGDLSQPNSSAGLLSLIKDRPLDFPPGTRSRYSNAGFILLGLVIERVSGMPYERFIQGHILRPLKMERTSYGAGIGAESAAARGLIEDGEGRLREAPWFHPSVGYSAGGLFSTVEDMWKWNRGLEGDRILSAASRRLMQAPQRDGYGLGWLVMETWGRRDIAHGGGAPGYSAWVENWPDSGVFIGVLSNIGGSPVGEIGRSLAAILFRQDVQTPVARRAIAVDPAVLNEYAGTFEIPKGGQREILIDGRRIFVRRGDGPRYPIVPFEKDAFFFPNDKGATLRFVRDEGGLVSGQIFHQLGLDEVAAKVRDRGKS